MDGDPPPSEGAEESTAREDETQDVSETPEMSEAQEVSDTQEGSGGVGTQRSEWLRLTLLRATEISIPRRRRKPRNLVDSRTRLNGGGVHMVGSGARSMKGISLLWLTQIPANMVQSL